jgi:small subunit ribosomal protein S1
MYVEMKPGVEGLIRMQELSWTRRGRLEDMYKTGDEVEFYVINVNEDKGQADLSIKRLTTDPWSDVAEKYKIGDNYQGKVNEIVEKGVRITVNGEVDAFMPKGRMRSVLKNGTIPYVTGQEVEVTVIDLDADKQSMILSPKGEGQGQGGFDNDGGGRRGGGKRGKSEPIPKEHDGKNSGSFSLGDMLGNLFGSSEEEK